MVRKLLTIDIRRDAVAATLIKSGLKDNHLEGHTYIPISVDLPFEEGVARAFEFLVSNMPVQEARCVISLPAEDFSFRNLRVPFKGAKKIRQVLPFELEPSLPLALDRMLIDFHQIQAAEQTDLLTAAIEISRVETVLNLLSEVDLQPEKILPGGFAGAGILAASGRQPANFLFADINNTTCALYVVADRKVMLARSFPCRATDPKRTKLLAGQVRHTLLSLEENLEIEFEPEELVLSGAAGKDLADRPDLSDFFNLPVRAADMLQEKQINANRQVTMSWEPFRMNDAVALALTEIRGTKGFDFCTGPYARSHGWVEHKPRIIRSACIAALVVILAVISLVLDFRDQRKRVRHLDEQIASVFKETFPNTQKIVDPLHQTRVAIKEIQGAGLSSSANIPAVRTIDILQALSKGIDTKASVDLTRLAVGPDAVLVSGETDSFQAVNDMKSQLQQAAIFKTVIISQTNKSDNAVRFKLKLEI